MKSDLWLWARLYSRERNPSLSFFFQILFKIKDGYRFPSKELSGAFPEVDLILRKTTPQEREEIRTSHWRAVEKGQILIYPGHEFYPASFFALESPPFLLAMQGSPIWLGCEALSVVGSREPSSASLNWLELHLAEFCRQGNPCIVSGGARGVDQKAHAVAMRTGRPTVAFVPSGLNEIYPHSLQSWVQEIQSTGGCLLSEYESSVSMKKHYFAQRNRLIAALGKALFLIEARKRSGTYLTAQKALEQSKPVWVLPGHPMDLGMSGSLDLLHEGATPVRDALDLVQLFNCEIQNFSCFDQESAKYLVNN
jgi:DNA processing protein